jgi:hypothetical protein
VGSLQQRTERSVRPGPGVWAGAGQRGSTEKKGATKFDDVHSEMKKRIIEVCDLKIATKGENVGLSFYAFFANKNDDPEALMKVATGGYRRTD